MTSEYLSDNPERSKDLPLIMMVKARESGANSPYSTFSCVMVPAEGQVDATKKPYKRLLSLYGPLGWRDRDREELGVTVSKQEKTLSRTQDKGKLCAGTWEVSHKNPHETSKVSLTDQECRYSYEHGCSLVRLQSLPKTSSKRLACPGKAVSLMRGIRFSPLIPPTQSLGEPWRITQDFGPKPHSSLVDTGC